MALDRYGCPLSTENPEVVQIVNEFSWELLRLGKKMKCVLEGVEKHPNEPILQIYAAFVYLYWQTADSQQKAGEHLDKASRLLEGANPREKSLFSVAWHWLNFLLTEALKDIERHCFKWPKDLTAIRIAEFVFYCKGQKYQGQRFLRLTIHCFPEHREDPYFLAIHSFALELCGKYDESLETAKKALALNKKNPWAHHTIALVYLNKGLIDEGIEVLEGYSSDWSQFSRIIETHNLWHLGLLYLQNLDFKNTELIYQRAQWDQASTIIAEQIDAAALLWRLDLEGRDNEAHWKKLADSIGGKANFGAIPYVNALLCYALKKGGRKEALQEALIKIEEIAHGQMRDDRYNWREIGLPLIYGSLSFADGDYQQTIRHYNHIMKLIGSVGGSDAQIDLFYQTQLKSLIGAHRYGDAENLLHQMTQGRDLTKLEHKWLAECHESHDMEFKRTG